MPEPRRQQDNLHSYLAWARKSLGDALAELGRQRQGAEDVEALHLGLCHASLAAAVSVVERVRASLEEMAQIGREAR